MLTGSPELRVVAHVHERWPLRVAGAHDRDALRRVTTAMNLGAWSFVLLAVACASPCEEAEDKMSSCQDEIRRARGDQPYFERPLGVSGDCSGDNECRAKCINDASCEDIASVMVGLSRDPNAPASPGALKLSRCLDGCLP
jgi:hypothetical protein